MTWLGAPTSRDAGRRPEGHAASTDGAAQLLPIPASTLFSFSSVPDAPSKSNFFCTTFSWFFGPRQVYPRALAAPPAVGERGSCGIY